MRPFLFVSPREAIEKRAGKKVKVRFDDGSDPERAAALAKESDVAVVFAADYQTEFVDRRCISLQCPPWNGDQDALIETIAAANERTVVVLETGGPVLTPWRGGRGRDPRGLVPRCGRRAGDRARPVRRRRPRRAACRRRSRRPRSTTPTTATARRIPASPRR